MKAKTQMTDAELDQLLREAIDLSVDEDLMIDRVYARLTAQSQPTGLLGKLQAFSMRWPAAAGIACILTAFALGLSLPFDAAAPTDLDVIALAFGDFGGLPPNLLGVD